MDHHQVDKFLEYYKKNVDYKYIVIPEEYEYKHLALCIVDAIYSINSKYTTTRNVVERTRNFFKLNSEHEYKLEKFIQDLSNFNFDELAKKVFVNRQRTSTKNGILKAEAVVRFSKTLYNFGINNFSDLDKMFVNQELIDALKQIPGQKSGISIEYFFMLCGDTNRAKMDRHIISFIDEATDTLLTNEEKIELMKTALLELKKHTKINSLRTLDYSIWKYMSTRSLKPNSMPSKSVLNQVQDKIDTMNEDEKKTLLKYLNR
jgi:hypothetical protein